ncbi:MAG: alpha/beta fold hydrolase [Euryarchaeota archaeon]|nr:alpha/beta fold hydrolase [Euryarchaeota archaeon]
MRTAIAILLLVQASVGCLVQERHCDASQAPVPSEGSVTFAGSDGFRLVGTMSKVSGAMTAVVMMHGVNEDRRSFNATAERLVAEGFTVFAYDQRGSGESKIRNGCVVEWESLTTPEIGGLVDDARLAAAFTVGASDARAVVYVGASIGANAALNAAVYTGFAKGAALLSPGIDYRGIRADAAMTVVPAGVSILMQVAMNDTYSNQSAAFLANEAGNKATLSVYSGGDHGTALLGRKDAVDDLVSWLKTVAEK